MRSLRAVLAFLTMVAAPGLLAAVHGHAPKHRHAARDWTHTIVVTPDGGVRIGNPQAKVAVLEFLSYTCPHCAVFAADGYPALRDHYIRTGAVSLEVRTALRDRADLVAATIARCGRPERVFEIMDAIFTAQADWESKAIEYDSGHPADFQGASAPSAMAALAKGAGLDAIAAQHGVSATRLSACFADPAIKAMLVKTTTDAWSTRAISGTPAFFINGAAAADVHGWPLLEPALRAALNQ